MKNKVFVAEEQLYGVHNIKVIVAKTWRDACIIAKGRYKMVVPKVLQLPLKKKEGE